MNAIVKAFECGVRGTDWNQTVYALSRGKAKYHYWLDVTEPWPDVKFTDITCRAIDNLPEDKSFTKTANYRGVPFARIGMKVECGGSTGVIVGKNSSANFDILFTDGKYKGQTLNCHPNCMMKYFSANGELLAEFGA